MFLIALEVSEVSQPPLFLLFLDCYECHHYILSLSLLLQLNMGRDEKGQMVFVVVER